MAWNPGWQYMDLVTRGELPNLINLQIPHPKNEFDNTRRKERREYKMRQHMCKCLAL